MRLSLSLSPPPLPPSQLHAPQLHSMSTFYPYFIYAITAAQLLITLAMCVHSYTTDSFANVGIASVVTECDLYAESSSELE